MIKVLFCGLKYEYGKPSLGLSYEYQNFYGVMQQMDNVEVEAFFIDEKILELGRDEANSQLIKKVENTKPDLLFCFLFTEQLKKETIEIITQKTSTKTFSWMADDHWRIPSYSRYWAPLFTLVGTTDFRGPATYKSYGITNVLETQWGVNTFLYKPVLNLPEDRGKYGISFVGQGYGVRIDYINLLKNQGLPAQGFGSGWPDGRVDIQEMINIFSLSKINLNFSETYSSNWKGYPKAISKLFVSKTDSGYKFIGHKFIGNFRSMIYSQRGAIKGRIFEVLACGGFLLTGNVENLETYYTPDKEIVIFNNQQDLMEKCKYYLEHEDQRQAITQAGYERTIRDHSYVRRFEEIFKALDLS